MKTIILEDHGQDFLEWDIDEKGVVVGCRPFQGSIWCGVKVRNKRPRKGSILRIFVPKLRKETTLKYLVKAIQAASPPVAVRRSRENHG